MGIIGIIIVAIIGSLLLMTGMAIVSDPTIIASVGHIIVDLFGPGGFFWYIFTLPVLVMLILLALWVGILHIVYSPSNVTKKL